MKMRWHSLKTLHLKGYLGHGLSCPSILSLTRDAILESSQTSKARQAKLCSGRHSLLLNLLSEILIGILLVGSLAYRIRLDARSEKVQEKLDYWPEDHAHC
jgi:hypothetical protein